jgi:hypothetical protein
MELLVVTRQVIGRSSLRERADPVGRRLAPKALRKLDVAGQVIMVWHWDGAAAGGACVLQDLLKVLPVLPNRCRPRGDRVLALRGGRR